MNPTTQTNPPSEQLTWADKKPFRLRNSVVGALTRDLLLPLGMLKIDSTIRWHKEYAPGTSGDVRMVLVQTVDSENRTLTMEQWQLDCFGHMPSTEALTPPMCPLERQPAQTQRPYCAQRMTLTPNELIGGPLYIHFEALMDRRPDWEERDLVIGWNELERVARHL
ncbi:uncharacterized protein BDV17DRAFT_286737 [Aspergillus undulatus]|uniref:uncharacterized protein n=1 Tax=Aspergillus undulatus TaxID=1810928 RepID=UPI003CCD43F8